MPSDREAATYALLSLGTQDATVRSNVTARSAARVATSTKAASAPRAKPRKKTQPDFMMRLDDDLVVGVWLRTKRRSLHNRTEYFFVHYCHRGEFHLGNELGYRRALGADCWRCPSAVEQEGSGAVVEHFKAKWLAKLATLSAETRAQLAQQTNERRAKLQQMMKASMDKAEGSVELNALSRPSSPHIIAAPDKVAAAA